MIHSLKVSPDGSMLASCGDDGVIAFWDLESGEALRKLRRDRPYERLTITGLRGLTQAQLASLRALGAVEDEVRLELSSRAREQEQPDVPGRREN
jgi:WD40 repeat protein